MCTAVLLALAMVISDAAAVPSEATAARVRETEIREKFRQFRQFAAVPLADDELLCECTEAGCDEEVVRLAGAAHRNVCRAHKGGVCRSVVQYDADKEYTKDYALSCVLAEELVPQARPFLCQPVRQPSLDIRCCSNASFCNHIEVVPPPAVSPRLLMGLFCVAVLFSAVGLVVGVFYCNLRRAKRALPDAVARLLGASRPPPAEASRLDQLLDDLEMSTSTGSGAGMPLLAQRTIARQIALAECIGRGRFGEVFVGEWRGEKVAVKIFLSRDEPSWQRETEIYRTSLLRHSNLLRFIASDNKDTGTSTQLWLITEYLPFGSLYDYLERFRMNPLLAVQLTRSIAHGLAYLHAEVLGHSNQHSKPGIAHRDIKTRNILLKNDMTCCIADLGLAVRCKGGEIDLPEHTRGGTARYLAPEFLTNSFVASSFNAYMQMDIYAFSLVVWELFRRIELPADGLDLEYQVPYYEFVPREPEIEEMRQCVCTNQKRPTIPDFPKEHPIMKELARLIQESWASNPNSRLTALNIRYSLDALVREQGLTIVT